MEQWKTQAGYTRSDNQQSFNQGYSEPQPDQPSQVLEVMSELDAKVGRISKCISALEYRLENYKLPSAPEIPYEAKSGRSQVECHLVYKLISLGCSLDALIVKLEVLTSEVVR